MYNTACTLTVRLGINMQNVNVNTFPFARTRCALRMIEPNEDFVRIVLQVYYATLETNLQNNIID